MMFILPCILLISAAVLFTRWGCTWGSTKEEQQSALPGDDLFGVKGHRRIRMTRAISIEASPDLVWQWMAQMGRGAGWYSYDWIDNGGKTSAQHLVGWIPPPKVGDVSPIGRLEFVAPHRSLTWWANGLRIPGGNVRCVFDIHTRPEEAQTRLLIRISADASGPLSLLFLNAFRFGDSIMARKQLLVVKTRVERYRDRTLNPDRPESGKRDQYQWMASIYSSGEVVGKVGASLSRKWRL